MTTTALPVEEPHASAQQNAASLGSTRGAGQEAEREPVPFAQSGGLPPVSQTGYFFNLITSKISNRAESTSSTSIEKANNAVLQRPIALESRRAPTQSYLAARRQPFLLKLSMYGQELIDSNSSQSLRVVALCRQQIDSMWQFTDERDEATAQYLDLIDCALRIIDRTFSGGKARVISVAIDGLLDKRLDWRSLERLRGSFASSALLQLPEPTSSSALSLETNMRKYGVD